jgi:2-oxoglutarate dehydrogenase E1 component
MSKFLRVEQLYPFPSKALTETLSEVPGATFVWCQEEPRNMGGWTFVRDFIEDAMQAAWCPSGTFDLCRA